MIKYLIFDLDGTLVKTEEANIKAYSLAFQEVGERLDEAAYRQHFGLRFDRMMEHIAPHIHKSQHPDIKRAKATHYRQQATHLEPNQALIDFLLMMKPTHKIGLATTASQVNADFILESCGLSDAFDAKLFGESVTHGKPDPECYIKCMQLLKAEPGETVIFEDSEIGIQAATAAGAQVVQVP